MDIIIRLIQEWSRLQRLTPTIHDPVKVLRHRSKMYVVYKELETHGVSRYVSDEHPGGEWFQDMEMR
jgi:hypothetical protein